MVRTVLVGFCLVLVGTACAAEDPATETLSARPDQVVTDWLAGVDALDLEALDATTHAPNVALLAGAENEFTIEQMASVVDAGLPTATGRSYWTTFRESLRAFLGGDAAEISVVGVEEFDVDEATFAAVTVERLGKRSEIIMQRRPEGWVVDLVATAGPALSVQIRRLVATLVAEAEDDVAFAYATMAVSSLGAALERDSANRALELELEAIEDLPIDLSR